MWINSDWQMVGAKIEPDKAPELADAPHKEPAQSSWLVGVLGTAVGPWQLRWVTADMIGLASGH